MEMEKQGSCCHHRPVPWYRHKTFYVAAALLGILLAAEAVPFLRPFRQSFVMYARMVGLPLILGLLLGGMMEYYVPKGFISHVLSRHRKRTILYSVLLGFLTSLCSHGILALAIQLHKKGASTSSVIAFLLASPWANMPLTLMLVGFFGLIKGFYIIGVAIVVALTTGWIYQRMERSGLVESNAQTLDLDPDYSVARDFQERFAGWRFTREQCAADARGITAGAASLADMVLWWILIGMAIASATGAYVPHQIFERYMGPHLLGLGVTLLLATVIEVCSEGSAPLAFEIFKQTGALGNSFVFLMAGVVTDYTEIGLIWQNVGRRAALFLPLVTVPQVLFYGLLANHLFRP